MDKFLESKFKLKGARALPVPAPPSMPAKSEGKSEVSSMSAVTCLPPIFTFSPLYSPKSSLHSSESTYAGSKQSQPSPTVQPQQPDAREQLRGLPTGVQITLQELHTRGQSQGVQTEDLESEHDSHDEKEAIPKARVVAYYIQPGGKVIRVVDYDPPKPKFDDGDPGPSTMRESVNASREHFNDEVYTSEQVCASKEIIGSEESIVSEEAISSEEGISSEEAISSSEEAISSNEEVISSSEELISSEEAISSEESISSDEVVSSQEDDSEQGVLHSDNNKHLSDCDSKSPEQQPALGKHEFVPNSPALEAILGPPDRVAR